MEKIISIVKKDEQEKLDIEFWQHSSIEKRFEAFNIIMQNYIAIAYGTDPGFQRVIRIVKQKRS